MALKKLYIAAAALLVLAAAVAIYWGVLSASDPEQRSQAPKSDEAKTPESAQNGESTKRPVLEPVRGEGPHELSGVVRGADGTPVALASVTALLELGPGVSGTVPMDAGSGGLRAVVANTNQAGKFVLQGLVAGRYRLQVESTEILSSEIRFVEAPGAGLQILVSRSVDLRGAVAMGKTPAANVKVFLETEGGAQRYESLSDASGGFQFEELPEGNFQIYAIGDGVAAPMQQLIRMGQGPFADVYLPLQQAFAVRGRVIEEGESKLGVVADVHLRDEAGIEANRRARSEADGSFVIESVLSGRWIAEAKAPGYLPTSAQSFLVESGRDLELRVGLGASVSGVVLGPNLNHVEGAVLVLQGVGSESASRRYSQANKEDDLASLLPGQKLLKRGELGVLLGPIPMPPPQGSALTRVAVQLHTDSQPAQALLDELGASSNRFVTDERGQFRITGIESGQYQLFVAHSTWSDLATPEFRVRAGEAAKAPRVRMRAGTRLLGKVNDDRGVPIAGASVVVEFGDGRDPILSVTDSDGSFVVQAISGPISLVASAVGHQRVVQKRRLAPGTLTSVSLRIELRLQRANAFVEARIVDSSGFSVRGATLRMEASDSALPRRSQRSDKEGLFKIDGLPKGSHWILAEHPDYPSMRWKVATGDSADLVMPLGGALDVTVIDKSAGSVLPMSKVELVAGASPTSSRVDMLSDETGKARFVALPAGKYVVRAELKGYAALSMDIQVPRGQRIAEVTKTVVLELLRGATVAGILRDAAGERVVGAIIRSGLASATSDREGRFRLEDVTSGTVVLKIRRGEEVVEHAMQLVAGEERVTLELVFDPEARQEQESEEGSDDQTEEARQGSADEDSADEDLDDDKSD